MTQTKIFVSKLSIQGKAQDELSYVFSDRSGSNDTATPVLFGLFHMFGTGEIYHSIIKETVKQFLDFFHRSRSSLSSDFSDSQFDSSEFIFENAIQYTNERVTQFLLEAQEENLRANTFDIKRIHFVLGALFGDTIFLSITGSHISPIYIYPVFRKEGFSHYAILNIGDDTKDGSESQRLFSNIVSGKLSIQGSTFVMCNQHFLDYISLDQLKQAVTNMSVQNLSPYFEGLLGKVNGRNDFSALFVNPHYTGPIMQELRPSTATNRSMAGLNSTAHGTTTILSPSVLTPLKPVLLSVFSASAVAAKTVSDLLFSSAHKAWTFCVSSVREGKIDPRALTSNLTQISHALSEKYARSVSFGKNLIDSRTREHVFEKISLSLRESSGRLLGNGTQWLRGLSRTSKALLLLGIIFALLFMQSIISIKRGQVADQENTQFQEYIRTIELKADLAEASLLYDNGSKAQIILAEAQALLMLLPQREEGQQERYRVLSGRVSAIRAKMARAVLLIDPLVVASFENQIPNLAAVRLVGTNTHLLLYTPEAVYSVDRSKSAITQLDTQAKLPSIRCASAMDSRYTFFCIGESNRLGLLDAKEKTVKTVSVDFHKNEKAISALSLYNNRLYVLDRASNMLYRHQKKGGDFGGGVPWLKKRSVPLSGALDIALDGTVFILTSPTTLLQFSSGTQDSFELPTIEPPLEQVTRIWTSDEIPYLLLLEPTHKRVVVIDKKSKQLKNQFVSEYFSDLKDLIATQKEILVVAGSSIYKIPLDAK